MPPQYAAGTHVSVDRSEGELKRLLIRYGATGVVSGWEEHSGHAIAFVMRGRRCRFRIRPPTVAEVPALQRAAKERRQRASNDEQLIDNELKRRWRELILLVKAKLVAVQGNIVEFDEEFLPYFVLPGGKTIAEHLQLSLDEATHTGRLPPLLPGSSE